MPREHGGLIVDGKQVGSTLQCPHCGGHFLIVPGSGKRRTFCMRCHAITCGAPSCDPCIPLEARLEFKEGTKTSYDDVIQSYIAEGATLI